MIRIGIYGNNLNQGYFLAQSLRDLGCVAKVFLPFDPEAQDTHAWWSEEPLDESLIIRLPAMASPGCSGDLSSQFSIKKMYAAAEDFDVLILREEGPALFSEFKGAAKVFATQGADIQLWPWLLKIHLSPSAILRELSASWRYPSNFTYLNKLLSVAFSFLVRMRSAPELFRRQRRQRVGILQCSRSIIAPYQRYLLRNISFPDASVRCIPLPSTPPRELSCHLKKIPVPLNKVYENSDLVFVHPARMFFVKRDGNLFLKDNDKLLKAFSKFVQEYKGKATLVLFRKGVPEDLEIAQKLINVLGVEDHVVWLPELSNIELRSILGHGKTVVCDQYSPYLNSLGNLGRESVYYGRPLITSYDGEDDVMYTETPPNVFLGNSVSTIEGAMKKVAELSEGERINIAKKCTNWYQLNLDPIENTKRYLDVCIEAIQISQKPHKI